MRVFWLTDLHLNFLAPPEIDGFLAAVADGRPDAVLISGDIGEAKSVVGLLTKIASWFDAPIYFVLGNHDFYFGSIAEVRQTVTRFCGREPNLCYLTDRGVVRLAPGVGLLGHDGWADARVGDYERSMIMMNDYRLIDELARYSKEERLPRLRALGDEAAEHVRRWLPKALEAYADVMLLTHVPPLREACWYQGQISDDEWSPHFTCQAVGSAILEIMPRYPDCKLTVLCGHTHSPGVCRPLPNVEIFTGGAEYGAPAIARIFELPAER